MSDGMLKKPFAKNDVQRLRNVLQGKGDERTTLGAGYSKKEEVRNEGDIWEEDGRKWTIKDGIKQNITKLDEAKKQIHLPLFCPECSGLMKHRNDKRFYLQYNRCFNCQVDFETELKIKGLWEEYEKNIINADIDNLIKRYSEFIDDEINTSKEGFVTEGGDVERWVDGNIKKKLLESKEETIQFLEKQKK